METLKVKIKRLNNDAVLPAYATDGSVCMDVVATDCNYNFKNDYYEYRTGLAFELPEGYELQIRPRSSIRNTTVIMQNAPGTLDYDYRGELIVCFMDINNGVNPPYKIGDRIAQICVVPIPKIEWEEVEELTPTRRGTGGHGSTGK